MAVTAPGLGGSATGEGRETERSQEISSEYPEVVIRSRRGSAATHASSTPWPVSHCRTFAGP